MKQWAAIAAVAILAGTPALRGQSSAEIDALRKEIQDLKKGQQQIQADLAAIKTALEPRKPDTFNATEIDLSGAPMLGKNDAPLTLVEFTDYQCPFCSRHYRDTFPKIVEEYVDTGKVRYILREFPLVSIHSAAAKASEAALCAGEQGKYWDMHKKIFENPRQIQPDDLKANGESIGLDAGKLAECLDGGKFAERVKNDMSEGQKFGVRGTPSFFLGKTGEDSSKFTATERLVGAQPYDKFKAAIDELLGGE
jgi:protein-disulfide isomerase